MIGDDADGNADGVDDSEFARGVGAGTRLPLDDSKGLESIGVIAL